MKLELWYVVNVDQLSNTSEYVAGPFANWVDGMHYREEMTGCFAPNIEIMKTTVDIE